ncbi:MAG: ABC transporter ATP-binding protein [Terriglobales bacterium]
MMIVESAPISSVQFGNPFLPSLSIENVTKDYKTDGESVRALDDISIQLGSGAFVAFVGRSGCGKSTLLNLAGAMDFPTRGHVRLDGITTDELSEQGLTKLRREKVGFIFQSFQLLHTLSVIENVELPLLLAGISDPRPRAVAQLESVELAGFSHRMPHQLSGGQMQRVAIARALVHSPSILLADEPTGNLDTATGTSIIRLLRGICTAQKTTILMATHSVESASVVDAVVRMRDGCIEEIARH